MRHTHILFKSSPFNLCTIFEIRVVTLKVPKFQWTATVLVKFHGSLCTNFDNRAKTVELSTLHFFFLILSCLLVITVNITVSDSTAHLNMVFNPETLQCT